MRARARAVELVPARPPTPLRAQAAAAMARAFVNARRRDEARRWCHEALAAARGAASADEEANALIALGMVEQYDDWPRIDDDAQPHPLALDDNRLNELDEA